MKNLVLSILIFSSLILIFSLDTIYSTRIQGIKDLRGQVNPESSSGLENRSLNPPTLESSNTSVEPLKIGVASMITPVDAVRYYQEIIEYIGERIGRPVKMVQRRSYAEMDTMLEKDEVQVAFICSGSYVMNHDGFGAELLVAPPEKRNVLRFGVIPRDNPRISYEKYQPFLDYLSEKTFYSYELVFRKTYQDTVTDIGNGLIDIALLGPLSYLEAHAKYGATCILKPLTANGIAEYKSVIVVKKDSPIENLSDLKGKTVAFASLKSTSGNLIPRYLLADSGIHIGNLKTFVNFNYHDSVVKAVLRGQFDAGAVKETVADKYIRLGLKVIASSEPIPTGPIVIGPKTPSSVAESIKRALLELDPNDRKYKEIFKRWDDDLRYGFTIASDKDYDGIRKIINNIPKTCGMVAIILLMSIIGYLAVERERALLYSEVEREGKLLAETLAIPIINDLIYERLGLVEEGGLIDNYVTETYKRQDVDLVYIAILNEEGKVIAHNDLTEYGKTYNDPHTQRLLTANTTLIEQSFNTRVNQKVLDVGTPLSIGKKRWGTLRFAISLRKVEEEIMSTITKIILLTIIFLIVGFAIILLLSRRFIRPITQIANTMEQARGDYLDVKVDVKGRDELALLGEKFNTMIERIKEANEELRNAHEKLVQSEKLASVGILAVGVAHEINNPLGGLFNCVHMLESKDEDKEFLKKYLNLIKEGLEKIENIVGKLLWVSRTGEGKVSLTNDVIKHAVSLVEYNRRSLQI